MQATGNRSSMGRLTEARGGLLWRKRIVEGRQKTDLEAYPIARVPSTSFTRSGDLDHLSTPQTVITRDRICQLDTG